jgi:arylsulfatase A-like enzyme
MKPTDDGSDVPPTRDGARRVDIVDVLIICLAGGFLAAAAEGGTLGAFRLLAPRVNRTADAFVWIVPVYYLVTFGTLALLLVVVTRLLSRRAGLLLATTASAGLAVFVMLLLGLYYNTNQWSLVLLALGAGIQAGRWGARHPETLLRGARISILGLGLPVTLLATGVPFYSRWQEGSWTRHLPPARNGAPNVLLIILDTVRAASTSLHGHVRNTTPSLSRLADNSVVFDRAYSTAPWTLPSHATMFTGRYPSEMSASWLVPLDDRFMTLAEAFREAGYHTGGFVANLTYTSRETGLARGFTHYEDYPVSQQYLRRATMLSNFLNTWDRSVKPRRTLARKPARKVNADFLAWIDQHPGRPFFAFLNYYEAHQPYRFDASLAKEFRTGDKVEDQYEAAIATLDQQIARLLDSLAHRGYGQNTIVVVTSDHGELLGEFNLRGHANSLYSPLLHVPLLIHYGNGLIPPQRIDSAVTLRDLAATIATLAGLDHRFPGVSLTRFWDPTQVGEPESPLFAHVRKGIRTPPEEPVSLGDMSSLIRGNLQLIQDGDGRLELYDLTQRAPDARNLVDSSSLGDDLDGLVAALRAADHHLEGAARLPPSEPQR